MRALAIILPVFLSRLANAAYKDEAGQNDFTISTAGHGIIGVTYVKTSSDGNSVLTSSSSPSASAIGSIIRNNTARNGSTGCYLSSRLLVDGSLNWRRSVCSQPSAEFASVRHAVFSNPKDERVYTLDDVGTMRMWKDTDGSMIKEIPSTFDAVSGEPRIVELTSSLLGGILTSSTPDASQKTEIISFFSDEGFKDTTVSASDILNKANINAKESEGALPSIFGIMPHEDSSSTFYIVAGWSRSGITSFGEMALAQVDVSHNGDGEVDVSEDCAQLHHSTSSKDATNDILVSSLQVTNSVSGATVDKTYILTYSAGKKRTEKVDMAQHLECGNVVLEGDMFKMAGPIVKMHKLQCNEGSATVLISAQDGATSVFKVNISNGNSSSVEKLWTSEEALAFANSAIFLDKGNVEAEEDEDDEDTLIASLSFSSRLSSQWENIQSFISGGFIDISKELVGGVSDGSTSKKEAMFGLNKIAVILSNHFSKVLAVDTSASSKGSIAWTLNLNPNAKWHKVVHGAASSRSSASGQGIHHPHSHEILVLSQTENTIEWRCVDGLRGRIISESTMDVTSPVVQVTPIHGHSHASGGCKQNAVLVFEDNSVLVAPDVAQAAMEVFKISDIGLYTHTIDKSTGIFRTMKINADSTPTGEALPSGQVQTIGETVFDPKVEKIINVAYPQRNEVVQSPATILGDDSLLVKYLNPHLCVVVTEATLDFMNDLEGGEGSESNPFYKALGSSSKSAGEMKPVGATKPGEKVTASVTTTNTPKPTLFINLLDTVSGQVLFRVSHSHAAPGALPGVPTNVPIAISENWIVYAFPNTKSRRTEVGVLTLHEGMINKHGITAFTSPEQQLTFSSLKSQKPIVLTKTYGVSYPVSAIGVTTTKGGISSKNFLLATGVDGKVVKIDRRLLDPRRPSGEPKTSEKKEGLMQYAPLLPMSPLAVESYDNNIEDATIIVSTSANLESQTLILALGGPDIFFSRFAPSKGFDSLPESFNKPVIVMVMLALSIVLVSLKRMGDNKSVRLFWS